MKEEKFKVFGVKFIVEGRKNVSLNCVGNLCECDKEKFLK